MFLGLVRGVALHKTVTLNAVFNVGMGYIRRTSDFPQAS